MAATVIDGKAVAAEVRERVAVDEEVAVEPDSRLAEILGWDDGWVNSLHHQAVDALGGRHG